MQYWTYFCKTSQLVLYNSESMSNFTGISTQKVQGYQNAPWGSLQKEEERSRFGYSHRHGLVIYRHCDVRSHVVGSSMDMGFRRSRRSR